MNWLLDTARNTLAGVGAGVLLGHGWYHGRRKLLDVRPTKPMLEGDPDHTPWRTWTDYRNAWRYRQLGYRYDKSLRFGAGAWRQHRLTRARQAQQLSDLWWEAEHGIREWVMAEVDGRQYAIDKAAYRLNIERPIQFPADDTEDDWRWRWNTRFALDLAPPDIRFITGITA